jgi:hypothetical protein
VRDRLWDVDVFANEDGEDKIFSVTIDAEHEDEAIRRATSEIRLALAFLNPFARVSGAKARER